ncbi:uncharacterized protein LOC141853125 [Brevipalpus obovatus]|uniref:uncharacterized protein LOC141853125 n=1 Tax=Brevipalpus obovatus TaxID=246614 RepID=UPI003D9EF69D
MDLEKIREKVGRPIDIMMAEVTYWFPEELRQEKLTKMAEHKKRILKTVEELFKSDVRVDFMTILRQAMDNPSSIRRLADEIIGENREHQSSVVGSSGSEDQPVRPTNHNHTQNPFYDPRQMFDPPMPPRQDSIVNRREQEPSPQPMVNGFSNSVPLRQEVMDTHGGVISPPARNMLDAYREPSALGQDVVTGRRETSPLFQHRHDSYREPEPKRQSMVDNRIGTNPSPTMGGVIDPHREPIRQDAVDSHQEPCPSGRLDSFDIYRGPGPSSQGSFGTQGSTAPSRQDPSDVFRYPDRRPDPLDIYSRPSPSSQGTFGVIGQPASIRQDQSDVGRYPDGRPDPSDIYNRPGPSSQGALGTHGQPNPSRQDSYGAHMGAGPSRQMDILTNSSPNRSNLSPTLDERMDWLNPHSNSEGLGARLTRAIIQTDPRTRPSRISEPPPPPLPPTRLEPPSPTPSASSNHSAFDPESGKSYVTLLQEVCAKRGWLAPQYELAEDSNLTSFRMRVIIMIEGERRSFEAPFPSRTKKESKALAAMTCLEYLTSLMPEPFRHLRFLLRYR